MGNPIVDDFNAATEFVKALSPIVLPLVTAAGIYLAGKATAAAMLAKNKAEGASNAAMAAAAAAAVATARADEVKRTQAERIALSDAKFGQLDEVTNQVNFLSNGGGDAKIDARMIKHGVIDDRRTQDTPVEDERRGQGDTVIATASAPAPGEATAAQSDGTKG